MVYSSKLIKKYFLILILICLGFSSTTFAGEDISWFDIPPSPIIHILSPKQNEGYAEASTLQVIAEGENVTSIEVTLDWGDDIISENQTGSNFNFTFQLPRLTKGLTLTVKGYGLFDNTGHTMYDEKERYVLSPKESFIQEMFQLAYANSRDKRYKFAPAQEDWDIALCKNFVMRLFDTFSDNYGMLEYPDLPLYMPKNNSLINCKPYDYGIEWRYEFGDVGSPFEIAHQFKYNSDISKQENEALCREMMEGIQAGDFFQMVGFFGGGNGPHSLLFMSDYDPLTDYLYWTDSNMRGTRIDGVRWGYLQYNVKNTAQWFVEAICTPRRGATVYRLRDDLFRK